MGILLQEHISCNLSITKDFELFNSNKQKYIYHDSENQLILKPRIFKTERNKVYSCYTYDVIENVLKLSSNYFVGLDWLTKDRFIYVEPKMNFKEFLEFDRILNGSEQVILNIQEDLIDQIKEKDVELQSESMIKELNLIEMLLNITSQPISEEEMKNLLLIDWESPMIKIDQKQDLLTPFLVIRFLSVLKVITRKGLKKSYYKVEEDLRNRVKGKIMVSNQIRQNVLKNKLTDTVCTYEIFGEDHLENQFLKKVFEFCTDYINNNSLYFTQNKLEINSLLNYIRPKFENISNDIHLHELKGFKHNPLFKEYKEASLLGKMILKRFSYHLSRNSNEKIPTPPYWIDMPKLFELYAYAKFLKDNPQLNSKNFNYQFSTFGNALDFLIDSPNLKMIVDTKYKLKYNQGEIHEDIRQVAGYARLKKVRDKLKIDNDQNIPCLIVYPSVGSAINSLQLDDLKQDLEKDINQIKAYYKMYKIGIQLPILK